MTATPARAATGTLTVGWGAGVNVPPGLTDVIALADGYGQSLAVRSNGTVVAWGANTYGQARVPSELTGVTAVSAGMYHSLVRKSDGTVVVLGGRSTDGLSPAPVGLSHVTAIAAGAYHNLALKSDGTVVGWGQPAAARVPAGLRDVTAISAGYSQSVALKTDGTVVAWGANVGGALDVPAGLTDVVAVSSGGTHSLALRSDGTVVGWGSPASAVAVPKALSGVTAIATGFDFSAAVRSDGSIVTWGRNLDVPSGSLGAGLIAAGAHLLAVVTSASTVAVHPLTDTYVNSVAPRNSYGRTSSLAVGGAAGYISYVRFVVPTTPLGRAVVGASLVLRTTTVPFAGSTSGFSVRPVGGTWNDATTWNTRPYIAPSPELGRITVVATNAWSTVSLDLSAVTPGTLLELALVGEGTDSSWFWSSNYARADYRPALRDHVPLSHTAVRGTHRVRRTSDRSWHDDVLAMRSTLA